MKKSLLLFILLAGVAGINKAQTVTDIEGNVYNTLPFGSQLWMKENLRTGTYNDGTAIYFPGTSNSAWQNNMNGAYSWYLNDSITYSVLYGALYNWYAVSPTTNGGKNICPLNWHVPSHDEWTTLERTICTSTTCATDFPYDMITLGYRGTTEGNKLKEAGTAHWNSPNAGTNSTQFTALPANKRDDAGAYSSTPGDYGFYWTSTSFDPDYAYIRALNSANGGISRVHGYGKGNGFSIRCVCDFAVKVDELNLNNKIKVYPNPASDQLFIENDLSDKVTLEVYSIMLKLEAQQILNQGKNEVDISFLAKGIYIIRINSGTGTFQKKVVVE